MTSTQHNKSKSVANRLFGLCMFAFSVYGCGDKSSGDCSVESGVEDAYASGSVSGMTSNEMEATNDVRRTILDGEDLKTEREESARLAIAKLLGQMIDIPGKDYKMCKYECTQALWESVMGNNPSKFKDPDRPVEQVSWYDCQKFLEKLNANPEVEKSGLVFRLPSEEEWEYACRAGSTGDYCKLADGSEISEETFRLVAWYDDNSPDETQIVGQRQPNAFGLYDMHGNVQEWTSTEIGNLWVSRGGSWFEKVWYGTCGHRGWHSRDDSYSNLGFRLAASAGQQNLCGER